MRGSNFIFDLVQLIHYKCHKVSFRRGGSYINFSDRVKKEKSKNKSKICFNDDDKCFQDAVNYEEIESHPEKVSNI